MAPAALEEPKGNLSLELALERCGLTSPDSSVRLVNHFAGAHQGTTLEDCQKENNAGRALLYLDDGDILLMLDFPRRELNQDLYALHRCSKDPIGPIIPLPEPDEGDIHKVRVLSQTGLDLLVGLVTTQLDGGYWDNEGLIFSRLSSIGVELPERVAASLLRTAKKVMSPIRLERCINLTERKIIFDFGLSVEFSPESYAKVFLDNIVGTDKFPTRQGEARADFLFNHLASAYPRDQRWLEKLRQNPYEEFGVNISSPADLEQLLSSLDGALNVWESGSEVYQDLISKLQEAGIPEEALWENRDFWSFVTDISANKTLSRNYTFRVRDENGYPWILKANRDRERAEREAAYNYYLPELRFITCGMEPHPIKFGDNLYFTLQGEIPSLYTGKVSFIEHQLACLARFHRDAAEILREQGVEISDKAIYPVERMAEEHAFLSRRNALYYLPYDPAVIREAIEYLEKTDYKVLVHGDVKNDNWVGNHLVDGEEYGWGHPALDLALLFMENALPRRQWGEYLHQYLLLKNRYSEPDPAEAEKLQEGMHYAPVYVALKEILGSTIREGARLRKYLQPSPQKRRLYQYTEGELRKAVRG